MDFNVNFDSVDGKDEYLKTRIECLDLPSDKTELLKKNNILTIRGLLNRKEVDLKENCHLNQSDINTITKQLNALVLQIKNNNVKIKRSVSEKTNLRNIISFIKKILKKSPVSNKHDEENLFYDAQTNVEENILKVFSNWFGFDQKIIKSKSRKSEVVDVRDLIIYILREYGKLSFSCLGRMLGGRDHTTIIHAYKKVQKRIKNNDDFENKFSFLIKESNNIKKRKKYIEKILIPKTGSLVLTTNSRNGYKEISEREGKILDLYGKGVSFNRMKEIIGISRQRIYQIIIKTVRQIAINKFVIEGVDINPRVLFEDERRKRKEVQIRANSLKQKIQKKKYWSINYKECKSCNTTTFKHIKNGLCERCCGSFRGGNREKIILSHNSKCDTCGISRENARMDYGRDLYISKSMEVFCRKCHQSKTGKILGNKSANRWKKFYRNR